MTGRRMAQDLGAGRGLAKRDYDFVESQIEMAHQKPGPKRPGRRIGRADDQCR